MAGAPYGPDVPRGPDVLSDDRREPAAAADLRLDRAWTRHRALVLAVVFVLGVSAGALGWDRWRDQEASRARESAVLLFARTAADAGDLATVPTRSFSAAIVVTNAGPLRVTLEEAELRGTGFAGSIRPVSRGITIPAGGDAYVALDVTADCAAGRFLLPETIALRVRTADGRIRAVRARLTDESRGLSAGAEQRCSDPASQLVLTLNAAGPPRVGDVGGRPAVTLPVEFQTYGVPLRTITSVDTTGGGLKVTALRLPVAFSGAGIGRTILTWQVGDCAAAATLGYRDLQLQVVARWVSGAADVAVSVDYDVALAVQRLIDRACPR